MNLFGWFRRHPGLQREVLVNLVDDKTAVRGVLWAQTGPWLVVKRASLLRTPGQPVPMDGDVVLERTKVLFIQVVG